MGADPEGPDGAVIRSSRVLLVDHVGLEGMVRAARIARAAGIPVVADLERESVTLFPSSLPWPIISSCPTISHGRSPGAPTAPGSRALCGGRTGPRW